MTNLKTKLKLLIGGSAAAAAGAAATDTFNNMANISSQERMQTERIQAQERMHSKELELRGKFHTENLLLEKEKLNLQQKLGYDELQLEREKTALKNQYTDISNSQTTDSSSQPVASSSQPVASSSGQNLNIVESEMLKNQNLKQDVEMLKNRIEQHENILLNKNNPIELTDFASQPIYSEQINQLENNNLNNSTKHRFCSDCIISSSNESEDYFSLPHAENVAQSLGFTFMCFTFTTIITCLLLLVNFLIMHLLVKYPHKMPKWLIKFSNYYNTYLIIENHVLVIFMLIFQCCGFVYGLYFFLYGTIW